MSDEEVTVETSDNGTQYLTAEFKDGRLQIVEVTPFEKGESDLHILPDLRSDGETSQPKYMQVLDSNKGLVQLDLLNLTLVRSEDGEESYQLVANAECSEAEGGDGGDVTSDATLTLLHSSDNEDNENQESYIMVDGENEQGPLVFLQSTLQQINPNKNEQSQKKPPTPAEILEKAKALQKAKALMSQKPAGRAGRKRKGDLPPPHELLSSPNFKLYLYSCKMCTFKCNAIKEMSAHKAAEHGHGAGGKGRAAGVAGGAGGGRGGTASTLQCARCPYRAGTHIQLMKHVQETHMVETRAEAIQLNTKEVEAADVLVCGACGFESSSRPVFRRHIEDEHGATTC